MFVYILFIQGCFCLFFDMFLDLIIQNAIFSYATVHIVQSNEVFYLTFIQPNLRHKNNSFESNLAKKIPLTIE